MDFRHELKHEISYCDLLTIRQRLKTFAKTDPNAIDGKYTIRSIYFDNPGDKALKEKINGVNRREKFRIRYYNGDKSLIQLEKKSKYCGLGTKIKAQLNEVEVQAILDGDIEWMLNSRKPLVQELYCKMRYQILKPKTIVDYIREPYIYAPGNVRITFDYNIRTGISCTDFLNSECPMVPAGDAPIVMEVKWDNYLPDVIKAAIQVPGRKAGAFSKYAQCRIYG